MKTGPNPEANDCYMDVLQQGSSSVINVMTVLLYNNKVKLILIEGIV